MNRRIQNHGNDFELGELVEALYDGVMELPLSYPARNSLVAIMLGDIMQREGRTISFRMPPVPETQRRVA